MAWEKFTKFTKILSIRLAFLVQYLKFFVIIILFRNFFDFYSQLIGNCDSVIKITIFEKFDFQNWGMQTKAKWDENNKVYKISGTKSWISNSPVADVMIVWARSDRHDNQIKVLFMKFNFNFSYRYQKPSKIFMAKIAGFYSWKRNERSFDTQNRRQIIVANKYYRSNSDGRRRNFRGVPSSEYRGLNFPQFEQHFILNMELTISGFILKSFIHLDFP